MASLCCFPPIKKPKPRITITKTLHIIPVFRNDGDITPPHEETKTVIVNCNAKKSTKGSISSLGPVTQNLSQVAMADPGPTPSPRPRKFLFDEKARDSQISKLVTII